MIRVTVELIPWGVGKPQHLGTAEIFNDATGTTTRGNYGFRLFSRNKRLYKEGEVKDFPRKRLLAYDLLYRVLREAMGERNE